MTTHRCNDKSCKACRTASSAPRYRLDLAPPGWVPPTKEEILEEGRLDAERKRNQDPRPEGPHASAFPRWNGTNAPLGLVRRMTTETGGAGGCFAPYYVVPDLNDLHTAAAGYNLIAQVLDVSGLSELERLRLAKLGQQTRAAQAAAKKRQEGDPEAEENATWAGIPRLTSPGIDIDTVDGLEGPAVREVSEAMARRLVDVEAARGVGMRVAWSGGRDRGRLHLDWLWGQVAAPELLAAIHARVVRMCAELGIPTSNTKQPGDVAWVDLVPLNHGPASRGRLWRPLGGLRESGRRKALAGWPVQGGPLTQTDLAADLAAVTERRADQEHQRKQRQRRRKRRGATGPAELVPTRREDLDALRDWLRTTLAADGPGRHAHRMAWAEVLRGSGFRDSDAASLIASALGNAEDATKLVTNTRSRHQAGQPNRGQAYLEEQLGTKTMARYAEILGRIRVHGEPKRVKPKRGAQGPSGNLRRRVRAAASLGRRARENMVAAAELLRVADSQDKAINGLLRPGVCRLIHERVSCQGCGGSRGTRRIACEDELCAWCHGSRVLHEHELVLASWTSGQVQDVLGLEVWGFADLAAVTDWVRRRTLPKLGLRPLKIKTHRYVEASAEETAAARAAGTISPTGELEGRIEHGILLLVAYQGWHECVLRGARLQSSQATLTRYTAAGAAERAAELRWETHLALRTASVAGQTNELARVLRDQFGRQSASGGKDALFWPGRAEVRASIVAEVQARRAAAEQAEGGDACAHDADQGVHTCPCNPTSPAWHTLLSSGRDDAVDLHRQEHPHSIAAAWRMLEQHRADLAQLTEHAAREEARELAACPF